MAATAALQSEFDEVTWHLCTLDDVLEEAFESLDPAKRVTLQADHDQVLARWNELYAAMEAAGWYED